MEVLNWEYIFSLSTVNANKLANDAKVDVELEAKVDDGNDDVHQGWRNVEHDVLQVQIKWES